MKFIGEWINFLDKSYLRVLQIDDLLKLRNEIYASYTMVPPRKRSSSRNRRKGVSREAKEGEVRDRKHSTRDRAKKKRWYNIHLKIDKRKQPC